MNTCTQCGSLIGADSPEALCSSCLLRVAMKSDGMAPDMGDETLADVDQSAAPLAMHPPAPAERFALGDSLGKLIGRYKIIQQIGEGGFGTVFMAEQQRPVRRKVALKIIKLGMDTKQVVARFEAERQALAIMDHPNIAKVLDAGATDAGRPYFVMELVRGVPITDYCNVNRLSVPERLELFVKVCEAVQHAHQKGIIHRDLKPSNVMIAMVDGRPMPKVIDFGIAKATDQRLTEKTVFTEFRQMIGTPQYMSPEQAEMAGIDIDTRSDVYSLGVLLYELLVGSTPFDPMDLRSKAYEEIQRMIREVDPPRPSTRLTAVAATVQTIAEQRRIEPAKLGQILRGELDWIVMRAMEKDRMRRYESAGAFARDVDRYLRNEQVEACPPSAGYRLSKLVHRHRTGILMAGALLLLLAFGTAVSTFQAIRATRAQVAALASAKAENQARQAEEEQRKSAQAAQRRAEQAEAEARGDRDKAELQRQRADDEARRQHRTVASLALERGINYCEHDEISRGALWMARALELAGADNPDLQWDARVNLGAWIPRLHSLQRMILGVQQMSNDWDRMEHDLPCLGYSADGKRVIVEAENMAQVWDAETGRRIGNPFAPAYGLFPVALSLDGRYLYVSHPKGVRTYDTTTQELINDRKFEGIDGVRAMIVNSDGTRLIASCYGNKKGVIRMWDLAGAVRVGPELSSKETAHCLAMNGDGSRLLVAYGKDGGLWDLTADPPHETPLPDGGWSGTVAFRPDGLAFVTSGPNNTMRIYNAATLSPGASLGHGARITCVAYSPDSKRLATCSHDYNVRIWDADTGKLVGVPLFHGGWTHGVTFSPDSKSVASITTGTVHLWRLAEPAAPIDLPHTNSNANSIAYSRDGSCIATGGGDRIARIWDAVTGSSRSPPLQHEHGLLLVGFTPDGQRLIAGDDSGKMYVWDWVAGKLEKKTQLEKTETPWDMALSPDAKKVFIGQKSHRAGVWDIATGKQVGNPIELENGQWSVAWSPDGSTLAIGTWSFRLYLIDAATLKLNIPPIQLGGAVGGIAFSADSSRVVACAFAEKLARVWDVKTGAPIGPALEQPSTSVRGGAFAPDGRSVAIGSGGTMRFWDPITGKPLGPALSHGYGVRSIAYSPDGSHVASASGGGGRTWAVPVAMTGSPDEVRRRIEATTGQRLDGESVRILNFFEWRDDHENAEDSAPFFNPAPSSRPADPWPK